MISFPCSGNFQRPLHLSWVVKLILYELMLSIDFRGNNHNGGLLQVDFVAAIYFTLLMIDMDYQMNNLAELLVKGFLYSKRVSRLQLHRVLPNS